MDREPGREQDRAGEGAGFPDALLLATPPYGSLNEREIGTTFGLRAQDALGWEPRRFHFLRSAADLSRARLLFRSAISNQVGQQPGERRAATEELLQMAAHALPGQFEVLDAKFIEGLGDAKPFAQRWAENLKNVPHTVEQDPGQATGQSSERGKILWIEFRASLWMREEFVVAPGISSEATRCAQ